MSQKIQIVPPPPATLEIELTHGVRTTNRQQYFLAAFASGAEASVYINMREQYYGINPTEKAFESFPL